MFKSLFCLNLVKVCQLPRKCQFEIQERKQFENASYYLQGKSWRRRNHVHQCVSRHIVPHWRIVVCALWIAHTQERMISSLRTTGMLYYTYSVVFRCGGLVSRIHASPTLSSAIMKVRQISHTG